MNDNSMCQVSAGVAVGSQRWKKGGSGGSLATLMRGCDDLCFYQLTLFNWHCTHRVTVIYVTINYSKITAIRNETMLNVILPISLKLCTHSRNILRMLATQCIFTYSIQDSLKERKATYLYERTEPWASRSSWDLSLRARSASAADFSFAEGVAQCA